MQKHTMMGGKVHLYRRENSKYWQCSSYIGGKNRRMSTKEESLALAKQVAEDWYLTLREKKQRGEPIGEKTFNDAADRFMNEYQVITTGIRSKAWVKSHDTRLRLHLRPFFGEMPLSKITAGAGQDYRVHRMTSDLEGRVPAHSTLHDEFVTLRMVLKAAVNKGWITHLPDLSSPYKERTKVVHRPWFSPKEYKQLYTATRAMVKKTVNRHHKAHAEDLHDMVLFAANTGLRPDEIYRLEHRDVDIIYDEATEETILEIEVRGKRGVGFCKSTANAVRPYERIVERNSPSLQDKVFPHNHLRLFNRILTKEGLKEDRDGQKRTLYSLRHTYICLRLMEGADIYQIAKNCRTSVEMIEKFYAAHIKNRLDAAAINVKKPKSKKP